MVIFRSSTIVKKLCLTVIFYSTMVTLPEANTGENTEDWFEPVSAVILADRVNIRAGCGTNFEVIAQADKTVNVQVTGKKNDWYKIRLPEGAFAFVRKDYILDGKVTANRLHARAGAGVNYNSLGILEKGQSVVIAGQEGDWLKIVPPENCSGWVRKDLLCLVSSGEESVSAQKDVLPIVIQQEEKEEKQGNSGRKFFFGRKTDKPPDAVISGQGDKIEVTGTIQEIGKIAGRPATHKLMQGKRIAYYLKSAAVNLNYFVYQEVAVEGTLEKNTSAPYPVINAAKITPKQ